ncbi:MAG TPA: DUF5343 domain-containing protein [Usitatibacteraceae bacterium]
MAADYPPFLNSYGVVPHILAKILTVPVPERFSHEFLSHTLGFRRDADRPFVPLARRMGFLDADGRPTALYRRFHEGKQLSAILGEAIRNAFSQLYSRHDNVDQFDRKTLQALVAEITGLEPSHPSARAVVGTFLALKNFATPDSSQTDAALAPRVRKPPRTAREIRVEYFGLMLMLQK